jgi:eukaryotic translation initiation factor 2C
MKTYKSHGGKIDSPPVFVNAPRDMDPAAVAEQAYKQIGMTNKSTPTIIFVVLPDKNQHTYMRFKKSMECRYAIVSQMLNREHVRKAQPQYCSNVATKVHCKLGGRVCRIPGPTPQQAALPAFFKVPTMMIGCDVSHGGAVFKNSPFDPEPSMAGFSVSADKDAATYMGTCQTNGYRREIVAPMNIKMVLPRLIKKWKEINKVEPQHVYYMRDGVAEGQFAQVLDIEVEALRSVFTEECGFKMPKFTVIVATKRHHIRFFPEQGDKNSNPLPGTLIDREVTHPHVSVRVFVFDTS